jgi:hypothetical protein
MSIPNTLSCTEEKNKVSDNTISVDFLQEKKYPEKIEHMIEENREVIERKE